VKPLHDPFRLEGRVAVLEAIKAGRTVDKLWLAEGSDGVRHIAALAKEAGAVVTICDRRKLDAMSQTGAHQGVIAAVSPVTYADMDDILSKAAEQGEDPLIVALDGIQDPHNLGAIIRTAEAAGAHGLIIPERRSATLTAAAAKAAAGALEYLPICKVGNLGQTLRKLKEQGLWLYAADMDGDSCYIMDMRGPAVLVIGAEGEGVGRLVGEICDRRVSIPTQGKIPSLNASVAAAILLFEVRRQRGL
jgi:23S rRNA (guanosine2251-2'-O)-methyltransferase